MTASSVRKSSKILKIQNCWYEKLLSGITFPRDTVAKTRKKIQDFYWKILTSHRTKHRPSTYMTYKSIFLNFKQCFGGHCCENVDKLYYAIVNWFNYSAAESSYSEGLKKLVQEYEKC